MDNSPGIARIWRHLPDRAALHTPFLVAGSQTELILKEGTHIKIIENGAHSLIRVDENTTFAMADYLDTGVIQPGKDYYVYELNFIPAVKTLPLLISLNSTFPLGATATNSRKIGGFHTLCCAVGTIPGHPGSGFATGAIIPNSVWCLNWRSRGLQAGMAYNAKAGKWGFIYGGSGTGINTASAYGAVLTNSRNQMDCADDLAAVGCRFLSGCAGRPP
jgi:hypothetical protein